MTVISDLEKRDARLGQAQDAGEAAVLDALGAHASRLRVRRGQTLALVTGDDDVVYILRSGALLVALTLPGLERQVVRLLLPGDVQRSSFVAPQAGATLTAAAHAEIWRLRAGVVDDLAAADTRLRRFLAAAAAVACAQASLHLAAIGRLPGEQRVATALLELAMRGGQPSPRGGLTLDMPFSRTDIADYLGLNPDTMSRIMSRFRSAGLLGRSERSRLVLRDVRALAALTPAAGSLAELYGERFGEALDH